MSVLDYGDVIYMHASSQCLHALDTVYHGALRFIITLKTLTHHCVLNARVGWFALSIRRQKTLACFYLLICPGSTSVISLYYICKQYIVAIAYIRSQELFLLSVPVVRTGRGGQ